MNLSKIAALAFSTMCACTTIGCTRPPPDIRTADEAGLPKADEDRAKAAQTGSVPAFVASYASDAVLPPNEKMAGTKEAIVTSNKMLVCDQTMEYAIDTPNADIKPSRRGFSGLWVGTVLDIKMCVALAVERIALDGQVSTRYAWGPTVLSGTSTKSQNPGVVPWMGKFQGDALVLTGSGNTFDLRLVSHDEIRGTYTSSWDRWSMVFRRR